MQHPYANAIHANTASLPPSGAPYADAGLDAIDQFSHTAEESDLDDPASTRARDSSPAPRSILRLRIQQDWTQARVAGMLKVDTRTVQKWESGKTRMPWATWGLLNVFSGMDVERLKYL